MGNENQCIYKKRETFSSRIKKVNDSKKKLVLNIIRVRRGILETTMGSSVNREEI